MHFIYETAHLFSSKRSLRSESEKPYTKKSPITNVQNTGLETGSCSIASRRAHNEEKAGKSMGRNCELEKRYIVRHEEDESE